MSLGLSDRDGSAVQTFWNTLASYDKPDDVQIENAVRWALTVARGRWHDDLLSDAAIERGAAAIGRPAALEDWDRWAAREVLRAAIGDAS